MDPQKAELKKLIGMMGWSQTDAAERLGKTPAAISHLVNPDHPNKPTQTTLRLLKMLIAQERPDLANSPTAELQRVAGKSAARNVRLSENERHLIQQLRELPGEERDKVYAVTSTLLRLARGRKNQEKR